MGARPSFGSAAISLVLVSAGLNTVQGGLQDVLDNTGQRPVPWDDTISLRQFSMPFTRLNAVHWLLAADMSARASANNTTGSSFPASMNASATVSFEGPAGFPSVFNITVSGSDGAIVSPGFNSFSAVDLEQRTGVITNPTAQAYVGTGFMDFHLSADGGVSVSPGAPDLVVTSTSLNVSGGVRLTYDFTPIGLVQSDPILPTGFEGKDFIFTGVPSERWFDPPSADGFRFDMISPGDSFSSIMDFPTGFDAPFLVEVDGVEVGDFLPGEQYTFGPGVRSFTVKGLAPDADPADPEAFPLKLAFNRDGVTFKMTAVPEPSIFVSLGVLAGAVLGQRKRRKSARRLA